MASLESVFCHGNPDWIVDLEKQRIMVYCFENDTVEQYDFEEEKALDHQGLRAGKGNRTPLPSLGSLYSIF